MAGFTNKMALELSTTVNKKRKPIGTVQVPFPTLQDFGINAALAMWTKEDVANADLKAYSPVEGKPRVEDGVPVYADPKADWLQGAIVERVKQMARNRFKPKSTDLRDGATLPEDFDSLTAETERTGEALKLRSEAKQDFNAFMLTKGKKATTVAQLTELFANSAKVLGSASKDYVDALARYSTEWINQLPDEKKARYAPKLNELQQSINDASEDVSDLAD